MMENGMVIGLLVAICFCGLCAVLLLLQASRLKVAHDALLLVANDGKAKADRAIEIADHAEQQVSALKVAHYEQLAQKLAQLNADVMTIQKATDGYSDRQKNFELKIDQRMRRAEKEAATVTPEMEPEEIDLSMPPAPTQQRLNGALPPTFGQSPFSRRS